MKINEISIDDDIKKMNDLESIKKTFEKYGWIFVGSGMDAVVAKNPQKNYVMKVFLENSNYKYFIQLISTHTNIHFPKLFGNQKQVPGKPKWSFVRIEPLSEIELNSLYSIYLPEITCLYQKTIEHKLPRTISKNSLMKLDNKIQQDFGIQLFNSSTMFNSKIWDILAMPSEQWQQACDLLCKNAVDNNISFIDVSSQNFMLRNKTLVIIDPYS